MPPRPEQPRRPNKPPALNLGQIAKRAGGGGVAGTAAYPKRSSPAKPGQIGRKRPATSPTPSGPSSTTSDPNFGSGLPPGYVDADPVTNQAPGFESTEAEDQAAADAAADLAARYPGLPPDVAAEVVRLFSGGATETQVLQYLRGTDWYKQEYYGIEGGIKSGVFRDEADYRTYKTGIKDVLARYGITDEWTINNWIYNASLGGWSVDRVDREFAADAYVKANAADINYTAGAFGGGQLTQDELKSLGLQEQGVSNDLGQQLQTRVGEAYKKMQRVFQGTLATGQGQPTLFAERRQRGDTGA